MPHQVTIYNDMAKLATILKTASALKEVFANSFTFLFNHTNEI